MLIFVAENTSNNTNLRENYYQYNYQIFIKQQKNFTQL